MNATSKPPRTKPQLYKDRKYLLVQFNIFNYAVLNGTKYKKTNRIDQAVLGYYPTLQAGLEEIIRLRAEDHLLEKVGDLGPFTSLDTLVSEYTIRKFLYILCILFSTLHLEIFILNDCQTCF